MVWVVRAWVGFVGQILPTRSNNEIKGLLCGGSCGAAFHHAVEVAKEMPAGSTVVCLLPDSIRNYMTRHLMDEWLLERELMPLPSVPQNDHWYNATCAQLKLTKVSSRLPLYIQS